MWRCIYVCVQHSSPFWRMWLDAISCKLAHVSWLEVYLCQVLKLLNELICKCAPPSGLPVGLPRKQLHSLQENAQLHFVWATNGDQTLLTHHFHETNVSIFGRLRIRRVCSLVTHSTLALSAANPIKAKRQLYKCPPIKVSVYLLNLYTIYRQSATDHTHKLSDFQCPSFNQLRPAHTRQSMAA